MVKTHRITRIVPPVWLIGAMIIMYFLHGLIPLALLVAPAWKALGQVMIFLAFGLVFCTARMFKRAQTPLKPFVPVKAMLVTGPFRYSRNPVYLGMFLMLAGWAVYLGSLSPWLVVVLFIWAIRRFWVLPEETQMEQTMGDAYLRYKSEVRRWL